MWHILYIYLIFSDIRSIHADAERVYSFNERAEKYFQKFISSAGTKSLTSLPYLHYLRNHTGDLMKLHMDLFGWGYGMYCCNAGEHLNKRIKQCEMSETNMDSSRFKNIVHFMRTKEFIFTDSILTKTTDVTCSSCGKVGHNRKNKSCPLHPSHPVIEFDESDIENDD